MLDTLAMIRDSLKDTVTRCYYSPVVETLADGFHGIRLFFDGNKSILIDFLNTIDEVVGLELSYGTRPYYGGDADAIVYFGEPKALAQILPFVKDFVKGNITEESGIYLPKT